jgi:hypothetical protein
LHSPKQNEGKQSLNEMSSLERLLIQDRFTQIMTIVVAGILFLTTLIMLILVESLSLRAFTNGHPASVEEIRLLFQQSLYIFAGGFTIALLVAIGAFFYRLMNKNKAV